MIAAMKSKPENVLAGIGPGIQKCHFEIKKDVLSNFKRYPSSIIFKNEKIYINLSKIIKDQLVKNGINRKNIELSTVCTFCNKSDYFSFRRDKPKNVSTMLAYIVLN